jgi:hypothetical protein
MALDPNAEAASVSTIPKEPYTMAHLSIAPATTTTVVTTTTTTTTQFPPLLFNPPRSLSERDPKEYPLAHAHAPESLRRFCFDVGGEQACFQEAKDVADTIAEVRLTKQGYDAPATVGRVHKLTYVNSTKLSMEILQTTTGSFRR